MKGKAHMGSSSSLLVSTGGLAVLLIGLVVSLRFGGTLMAGVFLFFLLLALLVRWWGKRAIENVEIRISTGKQRLFPGQLTTLCYEVVNNKMLPLAWLELTQNGPERDCLRPEEAFEAYRLPNQREGDVPALRQAFSFVGGFQTLRVETRWAAIRRGIYPITELSARTGDGFGLVQQEHPLPAHKCPTLAVYPRQVEVDLSLFLMPQWDCVSGRRGWNEDNTILRGNREYRPGDNWKHINWRMTAREQGLPVNLYETIQPRGLRFILDGESFCERQEELERTLEILSSVLIGLDGAGISCSLTLPGSKRYAAVNLEGELEDLLLHLAGYDPLCEKGEDNQSYRPSRFPGGAVPPQGTVFLITCSGSRLPQPLAGQMDPGSGWVLSLTDSEEPRKLGLRGLPLESLCKGGQL